MQESKKSFKDTLNLPTTSFPIRANAAVDDPLLIERWKQEDLSGKAYTHNAGAQKYILHDGPPYANGPIHLGHAYNKILKDMVCKAYRMQGYHVPVIPGWDCHGLPIELRVAQDNPGISRLGLIGACRTYAQGWIDNQRESFKKLGVLMDWDHPYVTMSHPYEASIVKAFGTFVEKGFIERKNKTVAWCWSCQTVLASAEIEYKDRKDPSIYVSFPLAAADQKRLFPDVIGQVSVLVWTTTPWTLPLNRAVMLKANAEYVLVDLKGGLYLMGAQVAQQISKLLEAELVIIKTFNGNYLKDARVMHPFIDRTSPLIFDESVGTQEGTAFVHCAPGCGPIDYEVGVKNNLEIYSPVEPDGKYSSHIEPADLAGMHVTDGQIWVIKKLHELGRLVYKTSIHHSYPHCWRSHHGLIFRATPQWFCNLDQAGLKERALEAIDSISFIPERGKNFLAATVENRWEWCLSRQRTWGAPIPALICRTCDTSYTNADFINQVAKGIETQGIEYWEQVSISDLVPTDFVCTTCKGTDFVKEKDILDVWFDSGISHYAVLYDNPDQAYPADMYLEGVDQHRGWFQSSLLTSLVLEESPAMKTIMTHGYTVDGKGQKMSKSLGNVVSPEDIVKQVGTDGLRLWVASVGYDSDPSVSPALMQNVAEVYRKIRNTARFLLSNLYDFDSTQDMLPSSELLPIDNYALAALEEVSAEIVRAYNDINFSRVFHLLADYCATELSAFYLDIVKDRLYVEKAAGRERRSAQTACWHILDTLTKLMAPIASFSAELISDTYQPAKKDSIHLQSFNTQESLQKLVYTATDIADVMQVWDTLKHVRSLVLKAIEGEREKGVIKHPLEAQIQIHINRDDARYASLSDFFTVLGHDRSVALLKELFIVSQCALVTETEGLDKTADAAIWVKVLPAAGTKCPRCWNFDTQTNPDGLCRRCTAILDL